MRLIDADELLKKFCHGCPDNDNGDNCIMNHCADYDLVLTMPTIDAEPIVRCKDCKLFYPEHEGGVGSCGLDMNVTANDYCSKAERKESEDNALV